MRALVPGPVLAQRLLSLACQGVAVRVNPPRRFWLPICGRKGRRIPVKRSRMSHLVQPPSQLQAACAWPERCCSNPNFPLPPSPPSLARNPLSHPPYEDLVTNCSGPAGSADGLSTWSSIGTLTSIGLSMPPSKNVRPISSTYFLEKTLAGVIIQICKSQMKI